MWWVPLRIFVLAFSVSATKLFVGWVERRHYYPMVSAQQHQKGTRPKYFVEIQRQDLKLGFHWLAYFFLMLELL